jgi:hypothetical protein
MENKHIVEKIIEDKLNSGEYVKTKGLNENGNPIDLIVKKSSRFVFHEIEVSDWQSYCVHDTESNKVVCHLLPQNGAEYCKEMGRKIAEALNGC